MFKELDYKNFKQKFKKHTHITNLKYLHAQLHSQKTGLNYSEKKEVLHHLYQLIKISYQGFMIFCNFWYRLQNLKTTMWEACLKQMIFTQWTLSWRKLRSDIRPI